MIEVSETIMDARTVFSYGCEAFEEATQKVKYLGGVRPLGLRKFTSSIPGPQSFELSLAILTWFFSLQTTHRDASLPSEISVPSTW